VNRLDAPGGGVPAEALSDLVALGRRLAAQSAEANFRTLTAQPGWTVAQIEETTEAAIARMDIGARDRLVAQGANPSGENWQAIWTAMEMGYREAMADLLRASGHRMGETLQ
jgi:hypothetical protein